MVDLEQEKKWKINKAEREFEKLESVIKCWWQNFILERLLVPEAERPSTGRDYVPIEIFYFFGEKKLIRIVLIHRSYGKKLNLSIV